MRVAIGLLSSAMTLLGGSVIGALGSWATSAGAVTMAIGAVCCAVALEGAGVAPSATEPRATPPR